MTRTASAAFAGPLAAALAAAFVIVLALARPAAAQPNAVITAHAYAPVPRGETMVLTAEEDSDANERLGGVLADGLAARGWRTGATGPLRLSFSTSVGRKSARPRELMSIELEAGKPGREEITGRAHVPLLEGPSSSRSGRRYRLAIRVFRPGGAQLWQGSVTAVLRSVDRHKAFRAMAPVLLNYFGKNFGGQKQ